jgi:hypothetical protein
VRADAVLEAVVDRADQQLEALERAEGAFDLFELPVGAQDLGGCERLLGDGGAQHVDPVEGGLALDLLVLAVEPKRSSVISSSKCLPIRKRFQTAPAASPIWSRPLSVPCSTRRSIPESARSVARSMSSRLPARSAATSGLRQQMSRSPGKSSDSISARLCSSN